MVIWPKLTPEVKSRWRRPLPYIWFHLHNSVVIARIVTKFDVETKTGVQKTVLPSDLTYGKIEDGGSRHFDIKFIGHISVATGTAHIRTKFATSTENNVPDTILHSDFTFQKSNVATTAILNFCLMATTHSLLAIAHIGTKFDIEIKIRSISIEIIKS